MQAWIKAAAEECHGAFVRISDEGGTGQDVVNANADIIAKHAPQPPLGDPDTLWERLRMATGTTAEHWLETAAGRIATGEPEQRVLADYEYVPWPQARRDAEQVAFREGAEAMRTAAIEEVGHLPLTQPLQNILVGLIATKPLDPATLEAEEK